MSNKRKRVELGSESSLADKDGDGYIEPFNVNPDEKSGTSDTATNLANTEVSQVTHYYPFGMTMEGEWQNIVTGPENNYLYNGKELNSDFDLNWSDYGARYYDAAIGRWGQVDPLAEDYLPHSPYNYVLNNPIALTDPNGMSVDSTFSVNTKTGETVATGDYGGDNFDQITYHNGSCPMCVDYEAETRTYYNLFIDDPRHFSYYKIGSGSWGGSNNSFPPNYQHPGNISPVEDPFTMGGASILKGGYKALKSLFAIKGASEEIIEETVTLTSSYRVLIKPRAPKGGAYALVDGKFKHYLAGQYMPGKSYYMYYGKGVSPAINPVNPLANSLRPSPIFYSNTSFAKKAGLFGAGAGLGYGLYKFRTQYMYQSK